MAIELPDLKGRIRIDDSALEKVGQSTKSLGEKLSTAGATLTKRLTLPIVGAGAAGVKMAADVDKGLREVNTLFGETGKAAETTFKELQTGTKTLSNEIGIAQDVLTGGLYQAISAGVPKDNAFEFLEIAAKAAVGGVTDTETAVDGLTTTLNAFGLDASRAQDVADSMFTAVKGGKTNFEELSASLFQVAPAAAAANVEFTDVNAALAALTATGTPTSVATTQMRAAIVELTKAGTAASEAFQEASGKTFPDFIAEGGNLQEALDIMKVAADENGSSMLDMFGSVEAGQAALTLTGKASDKFSEQMQAQADSTGAADAAFEEMNKSSSRQFEQAMVSLKNVMIDLGNVLLPIVTKIAQKLAEWANKFSNLPSGVQKLIVMIGGLVAAIGPAMFVIGKIISSFGMLTTAIKAVGIVFRGLALALTANPFTLIIAAVAALAFIIVKNWDTIKEVTIKVWNAVTKFLGEKWTSIKETAAKVWDGIKQFFADWWPLILGIFTGGIGLVIGLIVKNWDSIKAKTSEIWNGIKEFFKTAWENIKNTFTGALDAVKKALSSAWDNVKSTTRNAWEGIKRFLSDTWERIKSTVRTAVENARQTAVDGFNRLRDGVINAANNLVGWIRGLPRMILNALGNLGGLLWNAGRSLMDGLLGGIRRAWERVAGYLSGLANKIRNLKGPIEKDRKLLVPEGAAIMESLLTGLQSRQRDLEGTLSGITDMFSRRLGVPELAGIGTEMGSRVRPPAQQVGGNTYNFNLDGTWDLTNPSEAQRFTERVVTLLERRELGLA